MRNKKTSIVIALLVLAVIAGGCNVLSKKYRETKVLMGTIVHIDVCKIDAENPNTEKAYAEAWERLRDISTRMYGPNENSDVAKINNSRGQPVSVEEDTYNLLKSAQKYYNISNGAFDVTVRPLIDLWKRAEKKNVEPFQSEIEIVKGSVGTGHIELLADHQVQTNHPGVKLDLGGIAKGYAIDEVARIFRKYDILNFYIDAGGDIYVGGKNCDGKPWRVGIRDPKNLARVYDIVAVENKAVATSGNYEQFFTIKGKQFSHIIDPKTGYPQKGVVSSTVIAPSATEADALATALCVKGPAQGTAMIDNYNRDYASLILTEDNDKKIHDQKSAAYTSYKLSR